MTREVTMQRFLDQAAAIDAQPLPEIRYVWINGQLVDVLTLSGFKHLTLKDLFPTLKVKPT